LGQNLCSIPYRYSCIPLSFALYENILIWGETSFVYNVDLLRQLCRDIANEKDPEKEQDLVSVLRAVIREDQEEIRVRMAFLAKKYAEAVSGSKAAD
jgi:hypothetical protein